MNNKKYKKLSLQARQWETRKKITLSLAIYSVEIDISKLVNIYAQEIYNKILTLELYKRCLIYLKYYVILGVRI